MDSEITVYSFSAIVANFSIKADGFEIGRFGSGHINDTFLVKSKAGAGPAYLLQKINNFVFKDVDVLMHNMQTVIAHLKKKVIAAGGNPDKEVLTLVEAKDGRFYSRDAEGNYWRMMHFLGDTFSYDLVSTTQQAYQGGVAFGRFQGMLSDLDPVEIAEVIPDFLNIEKRLIDFKQAITNNRVSRLNKAAAEVEFLNSRASVMKEIFKPEKPGILPMRITHNDTKFNNILLDKNNNIQCVIDLDTVMPGYVAYDFGDAIRTIINTASEDEADLNAIQLNIPLFRAFARGYLSEVKVFITDAELRSLIMGVLLLPYMQAVRFLTDYLEGDVYYKIHAPEHNLRRTRAQMQLFKMLELNREKLNDIINAEWQGVTQTLTPDFDPAK